MELRLLCNVLGNFSMRDERYYFHMEGSMQGGHEVRGENAHKVTFVWWMAQLDTRTLKATSYPCEVDMR